eukprot:4531867-Amphidinium_carterae.2
MQVLDPVLSTTMPASRHLLLLLPQCSDSFEGHGRQDIGSDSPRNSEVGQQRVEGASPVRTRRATSQLGRQSQGNSIDKDMVLESMQIHGKLDT